MKIGDRVFVRGYIDEIRKDTVIIRNAGGYFGTIPSEVITGKLPSAQPENQVNLCDSCRHIYPECPSGKDDVIFGNGKGNDNICACNKYEPSIQPEPCEDTISRQAAIDALAKFVPYAICDESTESYTNGLTDAYNLILQLPSAPAVRKKGKWNFIGDQMFECTECGTCYTQSQFYQMRVRISDTEFPKFCPNCGARMEGNT